MQSAYKLYADCMLNDTTGQLVNFFCSYVLYKTLKKGVIFKPLLTLI